MSTIQEQYLSTPVRRTVALSEFEYAAINAWGTKQDALGDKGIPGTDVNSALLIHWHAVGDPTAPGGYSITEQSLSQAAAALVNLLDRHPDSTRDYIDKHGFRHNAPKSDTWLKAQGLQSHVTDQERNAQAKKEIDKGMLNELDAAMAKSLGDARWVALRDVDKIVVGKANGLVDWGATHRQKIEQFEALKTDPRFVNEPEALLDLDRRIAKEQQSMKW